MNSSAEGIKNVNFRDANMFIKFIDRVSKFAWN